MISFDSRFCRYCGAPQHGEAATAYRAQAPTIDQLTQNESQDTHTTILATEKKTIKRQNLCKRAVWSFFIGYLFKTAIIPFLLIGATVLELISGGVLFGPALFLLATLIYFISLLLVANAVYTSFYFEINDRAFRKEYGIIHKHDTTIPFEQIQNVNITRNLSDRFLGLARIDIETAGSSSIVRKEIAGASFSKAEGHLPGITLKQAKQIHDILLDNFSVVK
jgi:uncharacterized membrane protein YdbT with pleckstrin-like domain